METNGSTYIAGLLRKYFFQPFYSDYAYFNLKKILLKENAMVLTS
jgi:hypothetical protein